MATVAQPKPAHRYLREPEPLFFPVDEEMPETRRHLQVRTALFQSLQAALRVWDFVDGDLVERDPAGRDLYPTHEEAQRAAEARVRELEAQP